jgi:hypothetical protein
MVHTSGAGERAARLGLRYQDRASAVLAYQAILDGTLTFVALADDHAGMFDDLVIGIAGRVVGHQYKSSSKPKPVGVRGLLLGADLIIADCARSFIQLENEFPEKFVQLRYISSQPASTSDGGQFSVVGRDSYDFFHEKARYPDRSLAEWRASLWKPVIEELFRASSLNEQDFERFFSRFDIALGAPATIEANPGLDAAAREQIAALAHTLGDLVGSSDGKTRWTRRELLDALGWADRFQLRFEHRFPLGAYVQSNEKSEADLETALATHLSGYISLLGPPGAGKSTLLERFVQTSPERNVARYLAFVPGEAQGQGRGVDANFLADLISQLASFGYQPARAKDDTLEQKRETFERLLRQAGERYVAKRQRTIIVVDGLDHVPREERPEASFLRALPLPHSLPEGVLVLLGSQRIDLGDIPPEVRDQASQEGRRIEIAPLSEVAVADMAILVGLDPDQIDSSRLYEVSLGHPLVTRYLLGKLLSAAPDQRDALLAGGFEYEGDLERVYRQAWREAQQAGDDVAKTLYVLSFADGRIEPELLAQWLSSGAVDKAFNLAHHLIDHGRTAWRIFHNSFRLFLRQQRITLYGRPDPAYSDQSIYRGLAQLARSASPVSAQRFLEFRYLFLAGDHDHAAMLASRHYFVGQFIDGRRRYEVSNDIDDAVTCLGPSPAPEAIFDLMLAKDEIWRRQDVLSTADRLITAQLAAGKIDMAVAQLDSDHVVGDEWLVIRALLDAGQDERARQLFDQENPWQWFDGHSLNLDEAMESWADFAVVLLDREQIERRIRIPTGKQGSDKEGLSGKTRDQYLSELRYLLARAILRHNPEEVVAPVAERHMIRSPNRLAVLHLESAEVKLGASRIKEAMLCLAEYESVSQGANLHESWHVHATRLSIAGKGYARAKRLFARTAAPDLANLEYSSIEVEDAAERLIGYAATAGRLGLGQVQPAAPKEMLFRAAQNHAVRLGTMIGEIQADRLIPATEVAAQIKSALTFLAGAVAGRHDDMLLGYRIRQVDKPLFDALCGLVRLMPEVAPRFAAAFEECLQGAVCSFRDHAHIHRRFAETMFAFDGDTPKSVARLERIHSWLDWVRSPQEAVDLLSELVIAFANIGLPERGGALLRDMRARSLGAYSPAKKDGQYHLWEGLLTAANRADPEHAADRAFTMLRFISGVDNSEAHDQAWRIGKSVLVEAMASDSAAAWDAYQWAKPSGVWHWAALVDAVARGMLRRRPDLALPLAITWSTLCLPYYEEVYNSLTRTGQFLRELATATPSDQLGDVEGVIVSGLARDARPKLRSRLFRIFRDALAERGIRAPALDVAVQRWNTETSHDEDALPDYFELTSFDAVDAAVAADRKRREAQTSIGYGDFVNDVLGERIGRLLAEKPWPEVETFAARNQKLIRDRPVRDALAKAALVAGQRSYAQALFPKGDDDRHGWGGWSDSHLLDYHRARHLLGEPDAYRSARQDFLSDLAAGGRGTGSALAGVDDIFPLLFEKIDWPTLWARLDAQIRDYHNYRKADPLSRGHNAEPSDHYLIIRLYLDATRLGVSDTRTQAGEGLLALARKGYSEIFCHACRNLLCDGSTILFALRLVFEARNCDGIAQILAEDIAQLVTHADGGVSLLAHSLSHMWGADIELPESQLPTIYALHLPPLDMASGRSLRDEESLGPIIDDAGVWTESFESWLKLAARYSGVPVVNLRYRAAQLITEWGGTASFGAKAGADLRRRIDPLGLLLPFVRPHIGAAIRALRTIVGELFRANALSLPEFDLLLYKLDGGPFLPDRAAVSVRPADNDWPAPPEQRWNMGDKDWLKSENMKRNTASDRVIGEWSRFVLLESRTLLQEELCVTRGPLIDRAEALEAAIDQVPKAFWAYGRLLELDDTGAAIPMMRLLSVSRVGDQSDVLIFDPVSARHLGWRASSDEPFTFLDKNGVRMVSTILWRDGWEQEMRHGEGTRWADGQRVELTEEGLIDIYRKTVLPEPHILRWRRHSEAYREEKGASHWRSDSP